MPISDDVFLGGVVFIFGLIGGLCNVFLDGGLRYPRIRKKKSRSGGRDIIWDPGWIGTVSVGGVSAFVFWGLGLSNPDPRKIIATALLSGFAGGRLLENLVQIQFYRSANRVLSEELGARAKGSPFSDQDPINPEEDI